MSKQAARRATRSEGIEWYVSNTLHMKHAKIMHKLCVGSIDMFVIKLRNGTRIDDYYTNISYVHAL